MSEVPAKHPEPADAMAMTWPRWRLVGLLVAICFMAHFNRVSMAVAGDMRIMEQYEISTTAMGTVYSAFLASYTLFMIPGGWLIDRRGPRLALQIVCLGSAVFVVLTGCVGWLVPSGVFAFWAFIGIRFADGHCQRSVAPGRGQGRLAGDSGAAALDGQRPGDRRGAVGRRRHVSAVRPAHRLARLAGRVRRRRAFDGHRRLAVEPLCKPRFDDARQPAWVDKQVGARRSSDFRPMSHRRAPIRSWPRRNKNLLLLTFSYAAVGYFQYLFFYWIALLLREGAEIRRAAKPVLRDLAAVGDGLGHAAGRLAVGSPDGAAMAGERPAPTLAMVGHGGQRRTCCCWAFRTSEPFWIVTWLSLALGVLGMAEGPFWVTAVEVGGRRGGLSASIFNTGGNAGGILAPIVTPWISDALDFGWQSRIGRRQRRLPGRRGPVVLDRRRATLVRHRSLRGAIVNMATLSRHAMKITKIDCHVLLIPDYDAAACSSAQDDLVVEIHTDEGLVGIGETDTNPWVARECIRARGHALHGAGAGRDAAGRRSARSRGLWQQLYSGSKMTGRRGALICAMGAIDMALWDIRGQALRRADLRSCWAGRSSGRSCPMRRCCPRATRVDEQCDIAGREVPAAQALGFRAAQDRSLHQRAVQPQRLAGRRSGGGRDRGLPRRRSGRISR